MNVYTFYVIFRNWNKFNLNLVLYRISRASFKLCGGGLGLSDEGRHGIKFTKIMSSQSLIHALLLIRVNIMLEIEALLEIFVSFLGGLLILFCVFQ